MVSFLVLGRLLDRGYSRANTIAGTAFIILLADPNALEDSSFQMTFAAVFAVVWMGMPASEWAFGWLREALKDFGDSSKDSELSERASDWRVSRRIGSESFGVPTLIVPVHGKV